ncbi:MAG: tRNA (adenosine(37)-N6)-threonylcarbamoyltransferase complex ATPase subunit type 1 TsaE, partial [Aggregatilineales bacterium]
MREMSLTHLSSSLAQTEQLGARLGALLQAGDVLCLSGDLGAGKTAF